MIFWVAEIIDLQGPREILEGAGGPRGPKSILGIWHDLARSGTIWQDLAGSGRIWHDLDLELGIIRSRQLPLALRLPNLLITRELVN